MGKHFVLLHGAWHGGWCWEGVIKELAKAGHTAEAPTMPGHNPNDDRTGIKFENYVPVSFFFKEIICAHCLILSGI
jgi:hypothetical protein